MKQTVILRKILTGFLILLSSLMFSQIQLRIILKDGNVVLGAASLARINLITDYGKLDIPVKDVSSIKMGVKQEDADIVKTVDVVEINYTYNIAGQTNIKSLEVKTEYGILTIPGEKMESIEVFNTADGQTAFKLIGSKHISSNTAGGWLNTGIMVKKGQKLTISANGQVVLASLSGAKYTPDGKTVGTSTTTPSYDYAPLAVEESATNTYSYPTYGNVVFKIGEHGVMTRAGDKYTGISNETGILYLSIYEEVYNAQNAGSYLVKVELK